MSITAHKPQPRKRPRRELWHRKFIIWSTLQLEGRSGHYNVRFETVLRRWSVTKRRWLYLRLTPSRGWSMIGTDRRVEVAS